MSEIKSTTYIKFLVFAVIIGALFLLDGVVTLITGFDQLETVLKIGLIIAIVVYAIKQDEFKFFFNIHFSPVYLVLIAIPISFSIIMQHCPLNFEPYPHVVLFTVLSTITTAIWEELYFRYVGCSLFVENDGRFKWYNIVFLALAFSSMHMVNFFSQDPIPTLIQLFFTFGLGVFLLALYIATKAIIVPIIAHFLINSVADFYSLYASNSPTYVGNLSDPILIVDVIVMCIIGFYILKKRDLMY